MRGSRAKKLRRITESDTGLYRKDAAVYTEDHTGARILGDCFRYAYQFYKKLAKRGVIREIV